MASSSSSLYTRAALLQWANRSMTTNFATLDAVSAKDVALLLNAIYGHGMFPLNRVEFSASDYNNPEAQRRNCEVVVSQAAAHLGYEGKLSPQLWFAKEDSANELLFWRWIRQSAEGRGWQGCINVGALQQNQSQNQQFQGGSVGVAVGAPQHHHHQSMADTLSADNFLTSSFSLAGMGGGGASASRTAPSEEPLAKRHPRPEDVVTGGGAVVSATPTPTPQQVAAGNAHALQQAMMPLAGGPNGSSNAPAAGAISKEAEAYANSLNMLTSHLAAAQQLQLQQQQQLAADDHTHNFSLSSVPTDPYIAALIDAKNDRLLFLQSIRQRLIAACHAKDKAKVMEVMCEYLRGGPAVGELQQQQAAGGVNGGDKAPRMLV